MTHRTPLVPPLAAVKVVSRRRMDFACSGDPPGGARCAPATAGGTHSLRSVPAPVLSALRAGSSASALFKARPAHDAAVWAGQRQLRVSRLWTAIGMCPATVTKSTPRSSHRVIGFTGRGTARSAPTTEIGMPTHSIGTGRTNRADHLFVRRLLAAGGRCLPRWVLVSIFRVRWAGLFRSWAGRRGLLPPPCALGGNTPAS